MDTDKPDAINTVPRLAVTCAADDSLVGNAGLRQAACSAHVVSEWTVYGWTKGRESILDPSSRAAKMADTM